MATNQTASSQHPSLFPENGDEGQKSPRRLRWLSPVLAAIAGGLITVAVVVFSAQWFAHPATLNHTSGSGASIVGPGCGKVPQEVRDRTVQQVAQNLHLTLPQLVAKLQARQSLQEVATLQGITADQLQTIEVNAYQAAVQMQVSEGNTSQQQADHTVATIRGYDAATLNGFITSQIICNSAA